MERNDWLLSALEWLPSDGSWSETSVVWTLTHPMMRCRELGLAQSYNTERRKNCPVKLRWRLTPDGHRALREWQSERTGA